MPALYDYVVWYAEQTPDAEATVHDGKRQSYRELRTRVDALARAMLASGVRSGDRVATLAAPNPHYYETFLASVSIGAIWLGLNPRYRLEELCYSSGDSRPNLLFASSRIGERSYRREIHGILERTPDLSRVVLLDDENGDNGEGSSPAIVTLSDFLEAGGSVTDAALDAARQAVSGEAPCMIVYTSGSTGKPKGALLGQTGIIAFCEAQVAGWRANPMRVLNFLPINHVGCVVDVTCPALIAGGCVVFLEDFSPQQSLQLMQDEKITLWGSVPSVFQLQLAESDFENYDLSAVQMIFWGGAAMPRETIERLLGFGCPLATNYGMTESGSAIAAIPPSRDPDVLADTVGWPFPGVEVRLVKSDGDLASGDDVGEIQCRSVQNMLGYWERPQATTETLSSDGWLSTGDLGRRNADGSYSIVGRVKEMYKSGGYNVYPREIEVTLESHPAVEVAAVVSAPDPLWQEVGVAYVTANQAVTPATLLDYCRDRLANYKLPKLLVVADELPLLPIGKVDKVSLKKQAAETYQPA
ncbi:MAG: class I adenylate-forming enzyme family protein [Halieaceae bacterium]|jgi:acyl-CoA synthetase (AMP-forming)/AMP-acid ligase II|nr:class I adenylate-forming enzyme family protein [Halieaceae bacterium]